MASCPFLFRAVLLTGWCLILASRWQSVAIAQTTPLAVATETSPPSGEETSADIVFRNGSVYTVDAARRWAESVAVRDGRIVYVGTDDGSAEWIGPRTRVIALEGKMLLPGFHDAHVHLVGGGIELSECNLNGLESVEQIQAAVATYAQANPRKPWIRGGGWPLTLEGGNPHKSLLDRAHSNRPVVLDAFDGHSCWANSRAMEAAGITRETPDPPRGRIERDPRTGEPTGTLREAAMDLVYRKAPPYSHEEYLDGLRRGLELANRFGITSVQEASVREGHLEAFAEFDRTAELTVRAVLAMRVNDARGVTPLAKLLDWREKYRGRRLRATAVKIFEDGVIESRTAAVLEPYYLDEGQPVDVIRDGGDRGWLNLEPEQLNPLAAELDRLGFQIHIHAIGDRAIQCSLDAFEFAQRQNGTRDSRHQIAHLELFDPADMSRFQRLGVIANFQPLWACADQYIVKMTLPILGPARSRWLYPLRSVAETGAVIAAGSDWSVSSMNPLDAIQTAITRRSTTDGPGLAWIPEEVMDLPLMLAAYTIYGAYANFQEQETGSIEVGKAADLVVLDRNLFQIPKHEIHRAKVLQTFLEGREVYQCPNQP